MRTPRRPWIFSGGGALAALAAGTVAQRRHMRRIAEDPAQEALRAPPEGHQSSVRSPDGTLLNVETFGAEGATTIVLVHGWTESLQFWIYVIRALCQEGFRVVAYDQRGHGDSQPAAGGDYAIARFGEDLEAVLASCVPDDQPAVTVGHSLGAMSIVAWAEHHEVQARINAAALVNTGMGDLISENLLVPVPAIARFLNQVVPSQFSYGSRAPLPRFSTPLTYAAVRYAAFGAAASPAQIAFFERMLVTCAPDVRGKVGIALNELELHHALSRLKVPTLVLAGSADRLTPPSQARRTAEMLPDLARMIELPDTGHMAPLERPDEVIAALVELVSTAARAPSVTS